MHWPLSRAEKSGWFGGDRSLFFCSYFDNVDPNAADQGVFNSYYWGGLFALLHRIGWQSNWLQLFSPCATVPTPKAAMNWVQRFNLQRQEQGFHTFLEAYLSWRIVLRVFSRWIKLALISRRLHEIKHAYCPPGSRFSLWPLMQWDWHASMCGSAAVSNLLWIELFDNALRDLPHQNKGLYLCENQAWERALVHAWRKHRHGQLIAVAHSTVRFWDLRYFADPRTIGSSGRHAMPRADFTALNGKVAVDAYLSVDYPKHAIVECEALRYGYLNELPARHAWSRSKQDPIKVLILGDYMPAGTSKMLQLLEGAIRKISVRVICTIKPHPNCPVDPADYPSLHLNVVVDPLQKILHAFDIAYSGNLTTASVDAYLSGLPGVVKLDETELNFSPLRGKSGVRFVSTPEELAEALEPAGQDMATSPDRDEFFFLDPELPRWSRLLEN
jgi:surface carbohydrate biosynthesis protein (TIGR04326 family)